MYNSKISGLGMYVPENVVTNDDLSKVMDTSSEWIVERTGIKERRHIKKGDGNSTATMGVEASKIAMERAGIDTYILPQTWHFLAFPESRLRCVCLCRDKFELVA